MASLHQICFQLLSCQISISYEDPALSGKLSYLTVHARQRARVLQTLNYRVLGHGPYDVFEEGDLLDREDRPDDVLLRVYSRVYRRVLDRVVLAGWVGLHAGLVTIDGCRILLMGDKGAGKTTLMTRLLFDGHEFEGDELVLARPGSALSVPRRLHLKPGIEQNIPELKGRLEDLPITFAGELAILALDPVDLGLEWTISAGPVDQVVWISPNHGGDTSMESMPSFATLQCVLDSYLGWGRSKSAVVACAADLAKRGGHRLVLGDVNSGASSLKQLV